MRTSQRRRLNLYTCCKESPSRAAGCQPIKSQLTHHCAMRCSSSCSRSVSSSGSNRPSAVVYFSREPRSIGSICSESKLERAGSCVESRGDRSSRRRQVLPWLHAGLAPIVMCTKPLFSCLRMIQASWPNNCVPALACN